MSTYDKYKVASWLPTGAAGDWTISRFTVTPKDEELGRLHAAVSRSSFGRFTPAGDYTWLKHRGHTIMSDTPDEISDHLGAIHRARGRVLIHGLGLGMVAAAVLRKPEVAHVTVVEIDADVIQLVSPHLTTAFGARLDVVHADALTWKPPRGAAWDVAWHDIWPNICEDNLDEMKKLHRRFGRRAAWQGSWSRELIEEMR